MRNSPIPLRQSAPIQRGQGNLPFRSEEKNRVLHRGQEAPYNVNGAPTGATLADGEYGDVNVSDGGTVIEFDPDVVSAFARTLLSAVDADEFKTSLGPAAAQADSAAADVPALVADFNTLLAKLRAAGWLAT